MVIYEKYAILCFNENILISRENNSYMKKMGASWTNKSIAFFIFAKRNAEFNRKKFNFFFKVSKVVTFDEYDQILVFIFTEKRHCFLVKIHSLMRKEVTNSLEKNFI